MAIGHYEYFTINPYQLVVLPQVRKTKNSKIDEIAESIANEGLINPIDVTRLTYEELKNHIIFLNQLWKKEIKIDSFVPLDGYYYVVIAGHTRLEAIKRNAERKIMTDDIEVKIHNTKTSREILNLQLSENIHEEPRREEKAIAIIESYRLGIINGEWHNKNEFIKTNPSKGKISRQMLNDILVFADLPLEVQEYIFSGNVPYTVGVELGRIFPLIEKYEADFEKSEEELKINIKYHYSQLLNDLINKADSIKKALTIISGDVKTMTDHFRPKEELQQEMFDLWDDGADRQGEIHRKQKIDAYNNTRQALCSMPFEKFMELLRLDTSLTGVEHLSELEDVRKYYHPYLKKHFFESSLSSKKQ